MVLTGSYNTIYSLSRKMLSGVDSQMKMVFPIMIINYGIEKIRSFLIGNSENQNEYVPLNGIYYALCLIIDKK